MSFINEYRLLAWLFGFRTQVNKLTAKTHDCRDAGVRAMHGAIAERTQSVSLLSLKNFSAHFASLR
jgi:hypothetical protein